LRIAQTRCRNRDVKTAQPQCLCSFGSRQPVLKGFAYCHVAVVLWILSCAGGIWIFIDTHSCLVALALGYAAKRSKVGWPLEMKRPSMNRGLCSGSKKKCGNETFYPSGGMTKNLDRSIHGGLDPVRVQSKHERGLVKRCLIESVNNVLDWIRLKLISSCLSCSEKKHASSIVEPKRSQINFACQISRCPGWTV
jgi:hypothetical protein